VALIATFRWPTRAGAASATPTAALSGSQPIAPGFAGGYLLPPAILKTAHECRKPRSYIRPDVGARSEEK
jgi:hypothetical protein